MVFGIMIDTNADLLITEPHQMILKENLFIVLMFSFIKFHGFISCDYAAITVWENKLTNWPLLLSFQR